MENSQQWKPADIHLGIVISVHVTHGMVFVTGQALVLLESMKNQIRSACDGVVDLVNIYLKTQSVKDEMLVKINPRDN